jgi:hypothetical protein
VRRASLAAALGALTLAAGCRTYKGRTASARAAFYQRRFSESAELYARGTVKKNRNRLLYLLDAGMAHRAAGNWDESNKYFIAADELIEELNFRSFGEGLAAVVFDDRALTYRGEEFETVLVNTFLALNWLQKGGRLAAENALVECRRFHWKLKELNERRGRKYLQNAFSRYLSGIAYEMDREPNEAYVDYQKVHELRPGFEPVKRDLVRLAAQLGFRDHLADWEKKFGVTHDPEKLKGTGEVVVVLECGRSPEKGSADYDDFLDLPRYYSFRTRDRAAQIYWKGRPLARTVVLEDIDATARKQLSARMAGMVARRTGKKLLAVGAALGTRVLVRESTRGKVKRGGSRALADFAFLAILALLTSADRTDTRCWMTLPANLQVARVRLPAGKHKLQLHMIGGAGHRSGHVVELSNVRVREGRVTLVATRTLH